MLDQSDGLASYYERHEILRVECVALGNSIEETHVVLAFAVTLVWYTHKRSGLCIASSSSWGHTAILQ